MKLVLFGIIVIVSIISSTARAQGLPKAFPVGQEVGISFTVDSSGGARFRIEEIDGDWVRLAKYDSVFEKKWIDRGWFSIGKIAMIEKWVPQN